MTYQDYKNYWLSKPAAERVTNPDGVYKYQCVDLILDYIIRNGHSIAGIYGNAIDYATKPTPAFLAIMTKINPADAQPGDVVVLWGINGNTLGHITIFDHADANAALYWPLEQNGSTGNGLGQGEDAIGVWRTVQRSRIAAVYRPVWLQPATAPAPAPAGYDVVTPLGAYYTAIDAKNHANVRGTVQVSHYAIFAQYDGMINVTTDPRSPGSWINPADNHAQTAPVTGKSVTLPASSGSWHLYKEGSTYNPNDPSAVKGILRPDLFGGLTYSIERYVSNNRGAVIKTQDFGEGVVWLSGTPAQVK